MITGGSLVGILEVVKEGGRILGGKCDSGVWIVNQLMYRGVPCLLGGVLRRITTNIMRIKIKNLLEWFQSSNSCLSRMWIFIVYGYALKL